MQISSTPNPTPVDDAALAEILASPGFGQHFTDHMLTVEWTPDGGWHDARIEPYGPLTLDPATAVPRGMERATSSTGGVLRVVYSGWNTPVDISPPAGA